MKCGTSAVFCKSSTERKFSLAFVKRQFFLIPRLHEPVKKVCVSWLINTVNIKRALTRALHIRINLKREIDFNMSRSILDARHVL